MSDFAWKPDVFPGNKVRPPNSRGENVRLEAHGVSPPLEDLHRGLRRSLDRLTFDAVIAHGRAKGVVYLDDQVGVLLAPAQDVLERDPRIAKDPDASAGMLYLGADRLHPGVDVDVG